jgi:hypothetical protein
LAADVVPDFQAPEQQMEIQHPVRSERVKHALYVKRPGNTSGPTRPRRTMIVAVHPAVEVPYQNRKRVAGKRRNDQHRHFIKENLQRLQDCTLLSALPV